MLIQMWGLYTTSLFSRHLLNLSIAFFLWINYDMNILGILIVVCNPRFYCILDHICVLWGFYITFVGGIRAPLFMRATIHVAVLHHNRTIIFLQVDFYSFQKKSPRKVLQHHLEDQIYRIFRKTHTLTNNLWVTNETTIFMPAPQRVPEAL